MVFKKFKEALSQNDEKYEVLYHKYSQIRMENKQLQTKHEKEMKEYREKLQEKMASHLIGLFQGVEDTKAESFKVQATDKETQRLLISLNKVEKDMKSVMKDFLIEEYSAEDRFYDPELHTIASYEDAKGMKKGIILKTVKKGFKFKGRVFQKPKVVVTK